MLLYGKFATFFCCMICVLLHEMGHSLVGRHLGYKLNVITLLPYGAMLSGENACFSKGDEIKIAIAGPLVNIFLIVIFLPLNLLFPHFAFAKEFIVCNIYTFVFNILPVYPLDGGRVLLACLLKKYPYKKSKKITNILGYTITSIFFVMFFVSFFYKLNYMLGINALFMLIGLMGEDSNVYYEKLSSFDKFKSIPIASKIIKLDKSVPIFDAYKKLLECNASKVYVMDQKRVVKKFSRNDVLASILNSPLNTTLENMH